MAGSDPDILLVHVDSEQLESGCFVPCVSIIQRSGRSYKTLSLDMEKALFPTKEAAVDRAISTIRERLEKRYPRAEIRFT